MGDVVSFRRPKPSQKADGKTLCRHSFHKWEVWKEKQFDVKQGRLITVLRCKRCGVSKTKAL